MTQSQTSHRNPLVGPTAFYQTAYVTTDFDRALAIMGETYGLTDFFTLPEIDFVLDNGGFAKIDLALTWRGDTQYEIIHPLAGDIEIYQSKLPRDSSFGFSFHHFCQAFDTMEEFHKVIGTLREAGIALPIQSGVEKLTDESLAAFAYADFTATLGHHLEFICFTEAGQKFMEAVPRH